MFCLETINGLQNLLYVCMLYVIDKYIDKYIFFCLLKIVN